jgi:transposase, IS5 family
VQPGFFDLPDRLRRLSEAGDPLEKMARIIGFETFRPLLTQALRFGDGARGGRPPYDAVAIVKVLILVAQHVPEIWTGV